MSGLRTKEVLGDDYLAFIRSGSRDREQMCEDVDLFIGNIARRDGDAGLLEASGQRCVKWTFSTEVRDTIAEHMTGNMSIEVFAPDVLSE